mmetsp:Transcript_25914/g.77837  ORF Transcript_25914/g.77837 Transcript_25914/m.77837 type:complete len:495 (-) Transcript_25914:82-1566(-)
MSDRKEKKKHKKHKKEKKAKLYEQVGYTNADNPFGDSNLGATFTWRKKEAAKKEKPAAKGDDDRRDEIEKVRQRRAAREAELAEMERLRDEEQRLREAEQFEDWQAKEEGFHLEQTRLRSLLRLAGGRSRPVDRIAQNVLLVELGEAAMRGEDADRGVGRSDAEALDELGDLDAELRPPAAVLERLDAAGVREVRDDAAEYAAREGDDGAWAGFWKALLVLCDAALQGDAKASAALGAVGGDVAELIEGKDRAGLEETARDARARAERRRMNGGDDGFWRSVARACDVAAAKAALDEAHRDLLKRQLAVLAWRKERLAADPERAARKRPREDDAAPAEPADAGEAMRRREADRGLAEDEDLMLGSSEIAEVATAGLRKPRYLNRIKTAYEWNKYNQAHYTPEEPPPKAVQGYKFNLFYPDLVDATKPPIFKLEAFPRSTDFAVLRFKAGPPYADISFKIINQQWESQPKRGFRCVFERGILQLHFNFKRWRYRR